MIYYTTSQIAITEFFEKIHSVPRPQKYSSDWATEIGIKKDSNLGRYTNILKEMGFIDDETNTTALWSEFSADKESALQQGVKGLYSDLFSLFGNPFSEDRKLDVNKWFRKQMSDKNQKTIKYAINTFYTLCFIANFQHDDNDITVTGEPNTATSAQSKNEPRQPGSKNKKGKFPEISINLQIIIPDNAKPETYDNIFASIHKFIYQIDENENER